MTLNNRGYDIKNRKISQIEFEDKQNSHFTAKKKREIKQQ